MTEYAHHGRPEPHSIQVMKCAHEKETVVELCVRSNRLLMIYEVMDYLADFVLWTSHRELHRWAISDNGIDKYNEFYFYSEY